MGPRDKFYDGLGDLLDPFEVDGDGLDFDGMDGFGDESVVVDADDDFDVARLDTFFAELEAEEGPMDLGSSVDSNYFQTLIEKEDHPEGDYFNMGLFYAGNPIGSMGFVVNYNEQRVIWESFAPFSNLSYQPNESLELAPIAYLESLTALINELNDDSSEWVLEVADDNTGLKSCLNRISANGQTTLQDYHLLGDKYAALNELYSEDHFAQVDAVLGKE